MDVALKQEFNTLVDSQRFIIDFNNVAHEGISRLVPETPVAKADMGQYAAPVKANPFTFGNN